MKHFTLPSFWHCYDRLPKDVRELADKCHRLLLSDPHHTSLRLKKIGSPKHLWAVRVGIHYRALGLEKPEGIVWFWIGSHAEYDKLLS